MNRRLYYAYYKPNLAASSWVQWTRRTKCWAYKHRLSLGNNRFKLKASEDIPTGFRGNRGIYLILILKNQKLTTRNRLDLDTISRDIVGWLHSKPCPKQANQNAHSYEEPYKSSFAHLVLELILKVGWNFWDLFYHLSIFFYIIQGPQMGCPS